jgi:glycosyltransferase involved in cell wall biosynthesis
MGSGTPVIASDIAPHQEVVGRSRTGARLFREGDLASLVEALQRVDKDPDAERRAASHGAPTVTGNFDWNACVDRLEAVYAGRPLSAPTHALGVHRASATQRVSTSKDSAA